MALSWLRAADLPWEDWMECVQAGSELELTALRHQLASGINAPLTSSMGRLFDAVASIAGLRQSVSYEAQAAIELETQVDSGEIDAYPIHVDEGGVIDPRPAIRSLWLDRKRGIAPPALAALFHNGVSQMVLVVCNNIRRQEGISRVVLSGGVWQNMSLLRSTVPALEKAGFEVLIHRQVPANDGGIALGQAAVAHHFPK